MSFVCWRGDGIDALRRTIGGLVGMREVLRVQCSLCDREGIYHVQRLVDRFGPDYRLTDWLHELTEARAFEALCDEIIQVSGYITELFGELVAELAEGAVNDTIAEQVPDGPKISAFSLSFFFDENDALEVAKGTTLRAF